MIIIENANIINLGHIKITIQKDVRGKRVKEKGEQHLFPQISQWERYCLMLLHQKSYIFKVIKVANGTKKKNKLKNIGRGFNVTEPFFKIIFQSSTQQILLRADKSGHSINMLFELCRSLPEKKNNYKQTDENQLPVKSELGTGIMG